MDFYEQNLFSMISGIGDVIGHHHGKLEGQCILKGTDIQAKSLLQLFKTVHQSIPVHIELSGGFRKVQVIFKEGPDDIEGFVVNRFQGILLRRSRLQTCCRPEWEADRSDVRSPDGCKPKTFFVS